MLRTRPSLYIGVILCCAVCTTILAQGPIQESEDLYLAQRAFADGFYEIALKHFQKYLQENLQPERDDIQILIARCYLKLDNFSQALHTLQNISDKTSESGVYAQAIYWTAQTYFLAKDYESACDFFQKIIESYPSSNFFIESYYYRATCYYRREQFNQASALYDEFNKKFSKHPLREESAFHLAQCVYKIKDYPQARKHFKKFIKGRPKSSHINAAYLYLGEIEYNLGDFNKAMQFFTQAAEIMPQGKTATLAKYCSGWTKLKLGKYKEALNEFNRLEQMSGFAQSLEDSIIFVKGRCLASLGHYTEAIQMYERIIIHFPRSAWFDDAYFWKGKALYELAKYTQACQTYQEAIDKFSKKSPTQESGKDLVVYEQEDISANLIDNLRYNLGWTYAGMKKYEQAIIQFKIVFQDCQDRFLKSGALCRIGDIYLEQGNVPEAIESYNLVLRDFSDTFYADYAQYQLGISFSKDARLDSAILAFNALLANFPQSQFLDQSHYQIGKIYFRQGNLLQTQKKMEYLIEQFPKSQFKAQANLLRAFAYYNNEDYSQALKVFTNVLRERSAEPTLKAKAQYQIGFCFLHLGKEEKAVRELKRFLEVYPDTELTSEALLWLGQYYLGRDNFVEAQGYFIQLQKHFPRNELADDAAFWQAKTFLKQQRPKLAYQQLKDLQSNYPNSTLSADALLLQGDISKAQGNIEQAQALYKRVYLEFKGSNFAKLAHKKSAQIFREQKEFPQAIEAFGKALGASSDDLNAEVQFAIARCWEEQENYHQALDEYFKVCYLYSPIVIWSRKAQLKCAQIFERQAQWKKAKDIYEKLAAEENPEGEFARNKLKTLGTVPRN